MNDNPDWTKLGAKNKKYCAFDCCVPGGVNERELYAIAMADSDTSFFVNGGNGWVFGTPAILSPFLREYRALPALKFIPFEKARDPVAVWTREVKKEEADKLKIAAGFYFYAVNRLPKSVKVKLSLGNASKVLPAAGGEPLKLENGLLAFEIEPFMLKSFRAEGNNVMVKDCSVETPPELAEKLRPQTAFAKELLDELCYRSTAPELMEPDAREAMRLLNNSIRAADEKRLWEAKGSLERSALARIYDINGRFPPGLLERKVPRGFVDSPKAPSVDVIGESGIIGDVRGRLATVSDLAYDSEGNLWAASHDQVTLLDREGNYLKNLVPTLHHKPDEGDPRWNQLANPEYLDAWSLRITPDKRVAAMSWHTQPALYEPITGRLLKLTWGYGFPVPGMRGSLLAIDRWGDTYLNCPEPENAKGVYKFHEDGTMSFDFIADGAPSNRLTTLTGQGGAVDAAGRLYLASPDGIHVFAGNGKELETLSSEEIQGMGKIAVTQDGVKIIASSADGSAVHYFVRKGGGDKPLKAWTRRFPAKVTAVALNPEGGVTVGFQNELNGAVVKDYNIIKEGLEPRRDLVLGLSGMQNRCLSGFTQLKVYDGKVYYTAFKKLWRLAPGADQAELVLDPKWPAHLDSFEAFAIAPNGDIYLVSHWNGKARGANLYRMKKQADGYAAMEYLNGGKPMFEGPYFVVTDMEMDGADSLILRIYDAENNPHGRKVSIYRWTPDSGKQERLVEVGSAGANYGDYGLCRTQDGGLIVAGGTTRVVVRLSKSGETMWRHTFDAHQGEGSTPFRQPIGVTTDSKGRVWLTEPARNHVVCLDADGAFLKTYGHFGGLDDRSGLAFRNPIGIAAVKDAAGAEWPYIADVGNQRLVKWRLP